MNRCATAALFLFVNTSNLLQSANAHAFWAETDPEGDRVIVEFSEYAGVADKVVARLADKVTKMRYKGADATYDVSMHLNDEKNLLEGNLAPPSLEGSDSVVQNKSPYYVSGFLDYGPYERFHDLRYSFGAQVYNKDSDFDSFFRPLLQDVGDTPTIVMRNCGGSSEGTSYQFDAAGFPEGPLGVCIYRKGGMQLGCGSFDLGLQQEGLKKDSRERQLRGGMDSVDYPPLKMDMAMELMVPISEQQDTTLLYAKANKTVTDKETGDIKIFFASTSVYFHGPCKEE
jgi:hypothetical protein